MTGKQLVQALMQDKNICGKQYFGKAKAKNGKYVYVFINMRTGDVWTKSNPNSCLEKMYNRDFGIPSRIEPSYIAQCLGEERYDSLAKIIREFIREAY